MEPFEHLDFYQLLGVERTASSEEIKRAYRRQMALYHPDRFATASADEQAYAGQRSQQINQAYQVLSDFAGRSAYTRSLADGKAAPSRPMPTPPPAARDHQAELYEQARLHLEAGNYLQALATLRELQRINPFYRDSAALMAKAEAAAYPAAVRSSPSRPLPDRNRRRILLVAGSLGLAGLGAFGLRWLLNARATPTELAGGMEPAIPPGATATSRAAAAGGVQPPLSLTATGQPAAQATPLASPAPPGPTSMPSPSATPTSPPPTPTSAPPTATPVPPSPTPQSFVEDGPVLLAEDFSGQQRWAVSQGAGWSVSFAQGGYRILAQAGVGRIWSFYSLPGLTDHTLGIDLQVSGGAAGILLRFSGNSSYLALLIEPRLRRFSFEQRLNGQSQILAAGEAAFIRSGDNERNRLAARSVGSRLVLAINGATVADLDLAAPPPGESFGLIAIGAELDTVALFGNLVVRAL